MIKLLKLIAPGIRRKKGYIYRQGAPTTMGVDVSSKNENFALQYGTVATPPPANRRIRFTD